MSGLERGSLVEHATLGLGKVVAVEPDAVHVFFPGRGERHAAKLRLPGARAFLRTGIEERNAWLEGLSSFTLDAASGRWALPARWLTLDQAVEQFVAGHPEGFDDGPSGRGGAWRAAHRLFQETLGNGEAERLLDAGDLRDLLKRVLKIGRLVSPLHAEEERDALEDALGDDDATRRFLRALFELVSVPSPGRARFDKLFGVAAGLPAAPPARWLLVTLLPFIARPDKHPLMHPGSTREAAERLGFDLRWDETPNWTTLCALRAHSARLLEALAPGGARDFIDVEVFAHAASTMRAGGAKRPKRAARAVAPTVASAKAAARPAVKVAAKPAPAKAAKTPTAKPVAKPAAKATAKKAARPAKKGAKRR
ncbi:MAG TPA: hypothetical protein VLT47_02845 [Anaeromyxobacteraceae bacterium]|nr:hypothetical protein [Anaeromyxobacteraceae bacterium]